MTTGKNFLSDGTNDGYVEIQAGLARTQLEHLPLEAGSTYTWVEAYGALEQDPARINGSWQEARQAVCDALACRIGPQWNDLLESLAGSETREGEMIHTGSGWGCLEEMRRAADGEAALSGFYSFPESALDLRQLPWLGLLRTGLLEEEDPMSVPAGYLVDRGWLRRLEKAMEASGSRNWFGWMHLGLMRYANGDTAGAKQAFEASLACRESPWVLRDLAMLWGNELGDLPKALEYMERALRSGPDCRWLWLDAAVLCLKADENERWLKLYGEAPEAFRQEGRMKLYTAIALTRMDRLEEATQYLNYGLEVPDIKEDENLITESWFSLYGKLLSRQTGQTDAGKLKRLVEEKYPLKHLDFRMH